MSKFNTKASTLLTAVATLAATAAWANPPTGVDASDAQALDAQVLDAQVVPVQDSTPEAVDLFRGADGNADGALDRVEYRLYLDALAAEGDADALGATSAGEYDTAFTLRDTNADGRVDADELILSGDADVVGEPMEDSMEDSMEDKSGDEMIGDDISDDMADEMADDTGSEF